MAAAGREGGVISWTGMARPPGERTGVTGRPGDGTPGAQGCAPPPRGEPTGVQRPGEEPRPAPADGDHGVGLLAPYGGRFGRDMVSSAAS